MTTTESMLKLTKLERDILTHRLDVPDAIRDALADGAGGWREDGLNLDVLDDVIEHLYAGRYAEAFAADGTGQTARAVLWDCVDGSTYLGAASDESRQMQRAVYRAGCSLAGKVSALIGRDVQYPQC